MAIMPNAPSMSLNYSSIYGSNNTAAQMLNDIPESSYVALATEGLSMQLAQIESQISTIQSQQSAWNTLQSDAAAALSDMQTLSLSSTWQALTASSSNGNVTAAVDSSANAGVYTVDVLSLATQEIDGTAATTGPIGSTTTTLGLAAATMSLTLGGNTYSFAVSASTTLTSLASAINSLGASVTAQVEMSSTGYYLSLFGTQTGVSIAYGGNQTDWEAVGLLSSTGTVNVVQAASTAQLSLGSNVYTSSTNTFSSVIPGMTILAANTGQTTITVSPDTQSMTKGVQQLVTDWNQWVTDTQTLAFGTLPNSNLSSTSGFQTNTQQVIDSTQPMMSLDQIEEQIASFTSNGLGIAGVGLSVGQNDTPTLSLNTASLSQALSTNPSSVQSFFTALAGAIKPWLTSYSSGAQSITGTALGNLTQSLSEEQQQASLVSTEVTNAKQNALTQYTAFSSELSKLAQEGTMFNYLQNQATGSSTGG